MGNVQSDNVKSTKKPFGNVYGENPRPGYYIRNGKVVYKGQDLQLIPGETDFHKLKFGYLRSNKRVLYNGKTVTGANPATFLTVTRNNTSTLSRNPEINQEFVKLNSVLGMDFLGNKKRIYFKDRVIHEE
jgi:hypothetical protein